MNIRAFFSFELLERLCDAFIEMGGKKDITKTRTHKEVDAVTHF